MSKFHQKNGLTRYALSCGYQQEAKLTRQGSETVVRLSMDSACYRVDVVVFNGNNFSHRIGESVALGLDQLGEIRKYWAQQVREQFGENISVAKSDKRYTVDLEFCGEREPYYVARNCGAWVGKSSTMAGAWLLAYTDKMGF